MKKALRTPFVLLMALILTLSAASCQRAVANNELKPADFKQKLESTADKILLDVRTPGEYAEGHLQGALNIDWNGNDFQGAIAGLDKNKPVFVYCLAGSRSASAAEAMRKMGFSQVYEMKGGILKWRAAGLPEEGKNEKSGSTGMTIQDYEALFNTDKIVLVDFYATWCGPCKKMEPYLAEITKENAATISVVRIDADANSELANQLNVNALPTVFIYKNNELKWRNVGYVSKADMLNKLASIK